MPPPSNEPSDFCLDHPPQVTGLENLPPKGETVLVAANHMSWYAARLPLPKKPFDLNFALLSLISSIAKETPGRERPVTQYLGIVSPVFSAPNLERQTLNPKP